MKKLLLGLIMLFAFSAFAQDPSLPIDMEDPADDAWVANGVDYSLETVLFSPNQVAKIVDQGTVQWDSRVDLLLGTYIDMETPSKTFTFEFYTTTTDVMTGLFQISNEASAGYPIEMQFTTDGVIGWQTITLDFTNADNGYPWCQTCPDPQPVVYGQYARVSIFTNFGSFTAGTYYFDDIAGAANGAVVGADPAPASPPIPQPTAAAEDVISVFSDVYTDLATAWHPGWSQSTVYSDEIIVGTSPEDHISKLKYFSYDAVLLDGASNPTNVESMEYVHFDIWSYDETSIRLFLLTGPEPEVSRTLVPGQWNSFDIALTEFTGAVLTGLSGIKFESGTYAWPNGTSLVYLDNIYFWKTAGSGTLTFDPQNGATNVAVDIDPSLSFSIPVAMADDSPITNGDIPSIITFKETDASGADVPFTGSINLGEDVITVVPTSDLSLNQAYYLALNNEVIKYQGGPLITGQSVTFSTVSGPFTLPVTFDDNQVNYGVGVWGGNASAIVEDPTDPTNMVLETMDADYEWSGSFLGGPYGTGLDTPIPFAPGSTQMSMRVWSPEAGVPIIFKVENGTNGGIAAEVTVNTTIASAWETMIFDLGGGLNFSEEYHKIVLLFNAGINEPGSTYYCDDIEFINAPLATVWNGSLSNDWHDGGNWTNGVPTELHYAAIYDVAANPYPVVSATAVANSIFVATNAQLTIAPGSDLTASGQVYVDGNFYMSSDAAGVSASFIDEGGITGNGTFHFDRDLFCSGSNPANEADPFGWHYLSAPINGLSTDNLLDYYVNQWDEVGNAWMNFAGTSPCVPYPTEYLDDVEAWSLNLDSEYSCPTPGTGSVVEFEGPFWSLHSGGFSTPVTASGGSFSGWNMIGNPYPSAIDPALFDWTGFDNGTYGVAIYDGCDGNYKYSTSGNGYMYNVGPTQGFFMLTSGATDFTLDGSERVHDNGANIYKDAVTDLLTLEATGDGTSDLTYIRFMDESETGMDVADFPKLISTTVGLAQIYTTAQGENLAVNALPATPIVPMGFTSVTSGEYTISAIETSEFANVILEDRFTWQQTDLLTDSYTFNYNVNDDADRFFVHFTPLGIGDNLANSIDIWSVDHNIYVQTPEVNGDIVVYNMMGQEITRTNIEAGLNVVPVTDVNAFYVVKIIGSEVSKTGKVYVK